MMPGSGSTDGQSSQPLKPAKGLVLGKAHPEWVTKLELSTNISEDELIAGSSKVTYDDSLTACCSMTVHMVQELKHFTDSIQSIPQVTPSIALNDDQKAKVFTDAVIKCRDKTFDVHRVIIASQSPFFKTKLERWETDDRSMDMSVRKPIGATEFHSGTSILDCPLTLFFHSSLHFHFILTF